jgi:ribonuclease P protein component
MFTKEFRLRKEEVNMVFKTGKSFSSPEMVFRFLPNKFSHSRIAILVGVKLSKKAVVRNRIKRRLRELTRLHFKKFPSGWDILVIARDLRLGEIDFLKLTGKFLYLVDKLSNCKTNNVYMQNH